MHFRCAAFFLRHAQFLNPGFPKGDSPFGGVQGQSLWPCLFSGGHVTPTAEIARRRTFAIISHPDAGKTTLTERILRAGGAIQLAGNVRAKGERRRTRSDWMGIERDRGISVVTSVMTFEYAGCVFNLLDTPGHENFSEDTYRTLTAVDSAVMVIDAAKGIEAAHPQTVRNLPPARHPDPDLHQQDGPRKPQDPLRPAGRGRLRPWRSTPPRSPGRSAAHRGVRRHLRPAHPRLPPEPRNSPQSDPRMIALAEEVDLVQRGPATSSTVESFAGRPPDAGVSSAVRCKRNRRFRPARRPGRNSARQPRAQASRYGRVVAGRGIRH